MLQGVILAGGLGTRMRPATNVINKHLLCVYDRPMIYYPIQTFKDNGITDIVIITGEENAGGFVEQLGDGSALGVSITYGFQKGQGGIADALKVARKYIHAEYFAVILGDNYFHPAPQIVPKRTLYTIHSKDARRFGVFLDGKIVEKPDIDEGEAVVGLYVYKREDLFFLDKLSKSARGELEITDFNNILIDGYPVHVEKYKGMWSDMGTPESLLKASRHVHFINSSDKNY